MKKWKRVLGGLLVLSMIASVLPSGLFSVVSSAADCAHTYGAGVVTSPTCSNGGYTAYTCKKCGESYTNNQTEALGHSFSSYVSDGAGTKNAVCSRCNAVNTEFDPDSCNGQLSEEIVYKILTSLKDEYPQGMEWSGDLYQWNGGVYSGGYNCLGFAFMLSDKAFGDLPAKKIETNITIDTLRVGDVIRVEDYGMQHSVVLEVYDDHIVVVNGLGTVRWGQVLSADVINTCTTFVLT